MSWLYFTLVAYLINAVAFVVDKYLLSYRVPKPFAYAFWMAILSSVVVFIIPFGVSVQSAGYIAIALASGGAFFIGLIFLYNAIRASDISIASTMSGVATAIFSYLVSVPLLHESTDLSNIAVLMALISGMFFVGRVDRKVWSRAIWAGIFFGISFPLLKLSFDSSNFINGIFWTRVGFILVALLSLVFPRIRQEALWFARNTGSRTVTLFIGNKILAGIGFLILYYAIRLGEVSTINSLLGLQFLFIFIIAIFLRSKIPRIEENIDRRHILQKLIGIGLITIGFLAVIIL